MDKITTKAQANLKRKICDRIYLAVSRDESPGTEDLLAAMRMCSPRPADNRSSAEDPVLVQLDTILPVAIKLYQRDHADPAA